MESEKALSIDSLNAGDKVHYKPEHYKNKPPIGLFPKKLHDEKRFNDICDAISRYQEASLNVPTEWVEEYNELVLKVK